MDLKKLTGSTRPALSLPRPSPSFQPMPLSSLNPLFSAPIAAVDADGPDFNVPDVVGANNGIL